MSRNFGIMSGRSALGGTSDRPSASRADTPRENVIHLSQADRVIPLRRQSNSAGRLTAASPLFITTDPPLKFGKVTQALIDVGALLVAALVVSLTGIGAGVSLFILFSWTCIACLSG